MRIQGLSDSEGERESDKKYNLTQMLYKSV